MELRRLRYFVAVAEELHFTRAAARVRIAQPALSQQIRRLERELGVDLFIRSKHSVELTDTGLVFLEHARELLDDAVRAQQAAQRAERGELGRLVIGFVSKAFAELLPELLVAYRAQHPHVDVALRELANADQLDALRDGQIHVGLLSHRAEAPRVGIMLLRRERLVVAMPANHRLAGRRSLRLRELAGERWVHPLVHSSPFFAACAEAGFEPLIAQQESDHFTRMALIAAGFGLGVTGESGPRLGSPHIVYRPLHQPKVTIDLVAAWRKDRSSSLVSGFLEVARSNQPPAATSGR